VIVDVFRVTSPEVHQYDLPFYFQGQFLDTNVELTKYVTERHVLGAKDGYQHLWVEAEGQAKGPLSFTWMNGARYYTITSAADGDTRAFFVRIGANDPNFDLRNEPALLLRTRAASHVFATVIEPHGAWDGNLEFTYGSTPAVRSVRVLAATDEGTVVRIDGENALEWTLLISNRADAAASGGEHVVTAGAETFSWEGNAALRKR
jgi:hypothetical protein